MLWKCPRTVVDQFANLCCERGGLFTACSPRAFTCKSHWDRCKITAGLLLNSHTLPFGVGFAVILLTGNMKHRYIHIENTKKPLASTNDHRM